MIEIIGVRFVKAGKIYYFSPNGEKVNLNDKVVVETSRGVEVGHVSIPNKMITDDEIKIPLKSIIRLATPEDLQILAENAQKQKEAFDVGVEKILYHKLEMKLVDVEITFDRSKMIFYFTADGRIDFRELVRSLAMVYKTRIELRQIGVRDEARQLGSLGICGRFLCCSTFLNDFQAVSIRMAKDQGLSLNPTKLAGVCGRLMCCLQYEQNSYDYMLEKMPTRGTLVETADGNGIVIDVNTLKGQIRVKIMNGSAFKIEKYMLGDFKVLKKGVIEPVLRHNKNASKTSSHNEAAANEDLLTSEGKSLDPKHNQSEKSKNEQKLKAKEKTNRLKKRKNRNKAAKVAKSESENIEARPQKNAPKKVAKKIEKIEKIAKKPATQKPATDNPYKPKSQ